MPLKKSKLLLFLGAMAISILHVFLSVNVRENPSNPLFWAYIMWHHGMGRKWYIPSNNRCISTVSDNHYLVCEYNEMEEMEDMALRRGNMSKRNSVGA